MKGLWRVADATESMPTQLGARRAGSTLLCFAALLTAMLVCVLFHAVATGKSADQTFAADAGEQEQGSAGAAALDDITDSPYYYFLLIPLLVPTTSIFGYLNWMSLQFFRTG